MMVERTVQLIDPAGAIRNFVSLIASFFVEVCTLFLLIYF